MSLEINPSAQLSEAHTDRSQFVIRLEAKLKFRLSTFLLFVACIALATGWLSERRFYKNKLEQQVYTLQNAECSIFGAIQKNAFAQNLARLESGEISPAEFDQFKTRSLMDNVIYLYLYEDDATNTVIDFSDTTRFSTDQKNRMLGNAGQSLHLLGINNSLELNDILKNDTGRFEWFGADLFQSDKNINARFSEFVDQSIQYYYELPKMSD